MLSQDNEFHIKPDDDVSNIIDDGFRGYLTMTMVWYGVFGMIWYDWDELGLTYSPSSFITWPVATMFAHTQTFEEEEKTRKN